MATKETQNRVRQKFNLTLDPQIAEMALKLAAKDMPPEHSLSRVVDRALAEYITARSQKSARK